MTNGKPFSEHRKEKMEEIFLSVMQANIKKDPTIIQKLAKKFANKMTEDSVYEMTDGQIEEAQKILMKVMSSNIRKDPTQLMKLRKKYDEVFR